MEGASPAVKLESVEFCVEGTPPPGVSLAYLSSPRKSLEEDGDELILLGVK